MALNLSQKKHIIDQVAEQAKGSVSVLAAEYIGMTVAEMTSLRNLAREVNVEVKVVKNSLARRAFQNTDYACMDSALTGPLVLAFAKEGLGDAAKVFSKYAKTCPSLKVTALSLGGQLLASDQLQAVAKLPSRDEALSQLMGTMQAPVTKLAQTLQSIPSKLVRTIDAVKTSKAA